MNYTDEQIRMNRERFVQYLFALGPDEELITGQLWSDDGVCINGAVCEVFSSSGTDKGVFDYVYGETCDESDIEIHHAFLLKDKMYHCRPPYEALEWLGISIARSNKWMKLNDKDTWLDCQEAAYWVAKDLGFNDREIESLRKSAGSYIE